MTVNEQTLVTCNALLTRAIAAVETYSQVIDHFDTDAMDMELARIRTDHQVNVFELHKFIVDCHAEPATGSGTWNGFAEALQQSDMLLGESPVLKCLQVGEEVSITQYHNALADANVSATAKAVIKRRLLPALSGHLTDLQLRRDHRQ